MTEQFEIFLCSDWAKRKYTLHVTFNWLDRTTATNSHRLTATNVIVHRNYDSRTMEHDVAVIEFDVTTAELTAAAPDAIPICLASAGHSKGQSAIVSGWGTTSEGKR